MNQVTQYTPPLGMAEMEKMAWHVANSKLFGIATVEQAMVLMAIAQAEGRPAALAARDYDVIQGRPAKKAEALLRDFLAAGGTVEWHALTDELADATFGHPQGGSVRISWDMERARRAGLAGKENWKRYPRAMLRSRCLSEGCRTVCPAATSGLLVSDELRDELPEKDVTPVQETLPPLVTLEAVTAAYEAAQDVPGFQRAREMAAKLPEKDKPAARAADAETLKRLKGGQPSGPVTGTLEAAEAGPSVTLAKLVESMRSRNEMALLEADADLMRLLPADQQTEAAAEYHRQRARLAKEDSD